ncbi:MAG: tRNA (N(6)-L-threonylcarbamoyladenosine(37)-C(2))-methylthiotransferase MtaB [Acidobacteria bacterium]|nr:tRNA (N(6)-L-threonylcarbamoyladenosine(37)-C(2))-methylthiotransferase MtaB [Acidobacteriota bacterium]
MRQKFYLATFGCRVNQADSAALKVRMEQGGFLESEDVRDCSVIIVNSCTVTHRSDQQVRQLARRLRRENPTARFIVTGCYAQRDPRALAQMSEVDLVLGQSEKDRIVSFLAPPQEFTVFLPSYFDGSKIFVSDLSRETAIEVQPVTALEGRTRPHVKIQEGCDSRCSYCIVPFVRGVGRSVSPQSVIAQVGALVEAGYKEIVLTGIHLGSYGSKLKPRVRLDELVQRLLDVLGLQQIRLSSIEPMRFSRRLIDLAAKDSRFAPHFHLPLQSGANVVLRRMRRAYEKAQFADLVQEIHERLPDASIGTDVMVGFPGETEALFQETIDFIDAMPFSYLHVFPFSPRNGTPAASMKDQTPESEKGRRVEILRQLSNRKLKAFENRFLGKTLRALTLYAREGGYWAALTGNYLRLKVAVEYAEANELVSVRIVRRGEALHGVPVSQVGVERQRF